VPGIWRGTPPAIFPPVLGLLALGLAWRRAAPQLPGVAEGIGEAVLGAATLLALFALLAYGAKVAQRPGVLVEELRNLPGRAGVTAAVVSVYALAAAVAPYGADLARAMILSGIALHLGLLGLILRGMWAGPVEGRVITPVWHLMFVGFIVAALASLQVGWPVLARGIFAVTLPAAVAIWGVSLWQLVTRIPPAPLRPLLAIHVAPASLFAIVAAGADLPGAAAFAAFGAAVALALAVSARWLLAAGFSPLWGAFTFPLAALAQALLAQGWAVAGLAVLGAASVAVPWIAVRVLRMWAQGSLGPRTNAAVA
jgi:tellurite resistance protein